MALPRSPVFIVNSQYRPRVVDLYKSEANGPVTLRFQNSKLNQQWSLEQISEDTYNIQSQIDAPSFINAADGVDPPIPLKGNISPTTFTVKVIGITDETAVTIKRGNLYWTVLSSKDHTQLVLEPGHGAAGSPSEAQKWLLRTV